MVMELLLQFAALLAPSSLVSRHSLVALVTVFSYASDIVLLVASCFGVGWCLDVKMLGTRV